MRSREPIKAAENAYNLSQVLRLQRDLELDVKLAVGGETLTPGKLAELADMLRDRLPKAILPDAVDQSLEPLAGSVATPKLVYDLTWRLAGNTGALRAGRPVTPWCGQRYPEWVPMAVIECQRRVGRDKKTRAVLCCMVLAGSPCPLEVWRTLSKAQIRILASDLGFPSRRRRPVLAPEELVGLRLEGMMLSGTDDPEFGAVRVPPALKEHNRAVLRQRIHRKKTTDCPQGFRPADACRVCHVGYANCLAGCHRGDWTTQHCPRCARESYFDPDLRSSVCVACYWVERPW